MAARCGPVFDPLSGYCTRRSCIKVHKTECELALGHGHEIAGRPVEVYWEDDKRWYRGCVKAYRCECELCVEFAAEAEGNWHHVSYDDGTEQPEVLDFRETCWRFAEDAEGVAEEEEALTVVSEAEGMQLHLSAKCSTGYKGVWRDPTPNVTEPFQVRTRRDGRQVSLGSFATAVEAAVAYAKHMAGIRAQQVKQTGIVSEAEDMQLYLSAKCSFGYKGVVRDRRPNRTNPFEAYIRRDGRQVFLGSFATAVEAAVAYAKHVAGIEAQQVKQTGIVSEVEGMKLHLSARSSSTGYKGVSRKPGPSRSNPFEAY